MGVVDVTPGSATNGKVIERLYYNSTGLCKSYRRISDTVYEENLNGPYNVGRSLYVPFGWCGMYRDEFTGKYHTHFRDYDPIHARWLCEDPAGYKDGLNLYNAYMGVNDIDPLGLFDDEVMAMAFYAKYGEDGQDIYRYMYRKGYLVYKGQFDSLIPWRKKNIDIADTGAGKRNLWLDDDLDEEEAADLLWDYLNNSTMSHEYFLDKAANDPEALADLHMRFQRAGMDTAERTRRILRLAGDVGASFIPGEGFVETITGETPSGEKLAIWERALASAPLVGALKQIKTVNKGRKIIDLTVDGRIIAKKRFKRFITYTANDLDNPGKLYIGRASGPGDMTPRTILDRRKAGHHRNLGELQIDKVSDSYEAIRGREHLVREKLIELGKSTDQINPIGPRNKKKSKYINKAIEEFGDQ
jgi:RHS repeat-associated protein